MRQGVKALVLAILASAVLLAKDTTTAIHGTVTRLDANAKTIAVKTADGTEHTLHVAAKTTVRGTDARAKDTFKGLKQGSDVVARYTTRGADNTATEIDNVGKNGLKAAQGTVAKIDRRTKTLAVKGEDGSVQTFKMADSAASDAGKDVASGAGKSAKVTVYYTEEAGKKVAHFFENH